ncbi:uncharacterized protein LOC119464493 [Dermacentor silvarum]|uniref:uncharacterized protein LOC119464493 n=1 Tax=Dermacentor silvarum TaxID=543639 RepID=UPI00210134D5|nr:uncharacterized protein LOC119464493 [Dermacentor silvarum]
MEFRVLVGLFILDATSLWLNVNAEPKAAETEAASNAVLRIVTVFNTSERLWLYQQNYSNNYEVTEIPELDFTQKCVFLKKYNITEKDYNFWRKVMVTDEWLTSHYYGSFFKGEGSDLGSMNVTDVSANETSPFDVMTLMYAEENCSVFFTAPLEDDTQSGCELYVRQKAVSQGPTEGCSNYYNKTCGEKVAVYDSTCQTKAQSA